MVVAGKMCGGNREDDKRNLGGFVERKGRLQNY